MSSLWIAVRSADGRRESLSVSHDETARGILRIVQEWANAEQVGEVWFAVRGVEYRMHSGSEPQEVM